MLKRLIERIRSYFETPEQFARRKGAKIGKGCFISTKNFPSEAYLIEIGDYVRVATKTAFFTHGGVWALRKKYNDLELDHFGKIKIGNYSYIGENCMIMPGVIIGECCVIGGGSVVTKSVPDGCVVAGNPARFIGFTDDFYKKLKETSDLGIGRMNAKEKRQYLLSLSDDRFETKPYVKIPER